MKSIILILFVIGINSSLYAHELKIGALYSLTGAGASLGESGRLGAQIATNIINRQKYLKPNTLSLILEDSQSDPKVSLSSFRNLTGIEKVPAVVMNLTSVGMTTRDVAEQLKTPIFVDSIHTGLTENHTYVFRNFFSNKSANDSLEKFIKDKNFKFLSILHAEEDIGQEALQDLQKRAQGGAFEIVGHQGFTKDTQDVKVQLLKLKNTTPDLLYITGFGPAVALAYTQAKQLGLSFPIVGIVICGQHNVLVGAKEALEGTFTSAVSYNEDSERYKLLLNEYQNVAPGRALDQNVLSAYDNVWIIAEALKSGARTGIQIRDFIHHQKSFDLASGHVEFTPQGDSDRPTVMKQIHGGACEPLIAEQVAPDNQSEKAVVN